MRTFGVFTKIKPQSYKVGMKPLSERDENTSSNVWLKNKSPHGRNEATL